MIQSSEYRIRWAGSKGYRAHFRTLIDTINERVLCVDGENRAIISCVGENGVTTFLINGGTARLRNRERRWRAP
jgi:hypothetical protein